MAKFETFREAYKALDKAHLWRLAVGCVATVWGLGKVYESGQALGQKAVLEQVENLCDKAAAEIKDQEA